MNYRRLFPVLFLLTIAPYSPTTAFILKTTLSPAKAVEFTLQEQTLHLYPEKAVYWQEQNCLLLSDLHLGKAGHFRKAGMAVPATLHQNDLQRLDWLLQQTGAGCVYFLGDLFHSELNSEWWTFARWLEQYPAREFILIRGNHDILPEEAYASSRLQIIREELIISPFILTHEPLAGKSRKGGIYNICGHIHPAVRLKGAAFQQLTLPCFYFGLHYGVLPAFGKFTGFSQIKPKKGDSVFAIAENAVLRL